MDEQLGVADDAPDPAARDSFDETVAVAYDTTTESEREKSDGKEGEEGVEETQGEGAEEKAAASQPIVERPPFWTLVWQSVIRDVNQSQMVKLLVATLVASVISTLLNGAVYAISSFICSFSPHLTFMIQVFPE